MQPLTLPRTRGYNSAHDHRVCSGTGLW